MQTKVIGIGDLKKNLDKLSGEMRDKGAERATRAGIAAIRKEAQVLVPVKTGNLKKSMVIRKVSKKGAAKTRFFLGHTTGKGAKYDGWYAHIVEFGSKPHDIFGKLRPGTEHRTPMGKEAQFGVHVSHSGAKPRSFMRRAFNTKQDKAIEEMNKRLAKFIEKGK